MIIRTSQDRANIIFQHFDLLACDLRPAGVVAYHRHDREAMSNERVKF
jgi:hypothetical protein